MNLKPWEFGRLQPHEFRAMIDGCNKRQTNLENTLAYFVCQLMNLEGKALKEPIKPIDLLRPIRESVKKIDQQKADEEYFKERFKGML